MNRVMVIISVLVVLASCARAEQGYWTKPDTSQAFTNERFPGDSRYCERVAAQNGGNNSQTTREQFYTKCMYARGYEWIEEPQSRHEISADESSGTYFCPTGRRIIDAFGYTKCVPIEGKGGRPSPEVKQSVTTSETNTNAAREKPVPSVAPRETKERWIREDSECRHQADIALSSPYGVYVNCMQEKGWPSNH